MENNTTYLLTFELKNESLDFTDISRFEYILQLSETECKKKEIGFSEALFGGRNATISNNNLNVYCYKIRIYSVLLNFCDRLKKATDFTRRLCYLYDSIEFHVNKQNGVIQEVCNAEELDRNANAIVELLKRDYKGQVVDEYLDKTIRTISEMGFENSVNNYMIYGLLFPEIPPKHEGDWEHSRLIVPSVYDGVAFSESIKYKRTEEQIRIYDVNGSLPEHTTLQLEQFAGKLHVKEDRLLPEYAKIKIRYNHSGVLNSWGFELVRY